MDGMKHREKPVIRSAVGASGRVGRRPPCAFGGSREREEEIKALIRSYPQMYAELLAREKDVIFGRADWSAGMMPGPRRARPTEAKTVSLDTDAIVQGLRLRCAAVCRCMQQLRPEYRRVICLRFWGVGEDELALSRVCAGIPLHGLRFGSTRGLQTVEELAGYSERQAGRIVRLFIAMVRDELERSSETAGIPDGGF